MISALATTEHLLEAGNARGLQWTHYGTYDGKGDWIVLRPEETTTLR